MKNILCLVLLCAVSSVVAAQQTAPKTTPGDTIKAGWGDLNYAVPESPAFKILGTSPSNIMRPTSARDIAFSVGNYFATNGGTIPQNLAVEISPALLNTKLKLADYKNNRLLYTSSLSLGTKVNSDKSYAIGIGLTFRLIDKQDLRANDVLKDQLNALLLAGNTTYAEALRTIAKSYSDDDKTHPNAYIYWRRKIAAAYKDTDKNASDTTKMLKAKMTAYITKTFFAEKIDSIRTSVKNRSWNKPIWEVGLATLFNSKDSLLRDIKAASRSGLWTTLGLPVFGTRGQLLLGVTEQVRDTTGKRFGVNMLNIGSRLYYGANDLKYFVEANGQFQTYQAHTYKASLGIETTFFGGMWVDFSLGLSKQGSAPVAFTPGFNFFFANGEKKSSSKL